MTLKEIDKITSSETIMNLFVCLYNIKQNDTSICKSKQVLEECKCIMKNIKDELDKSL